MGFLRPDQGRVIVAHEDTTDFAEADLRRIRKKVTMVFQSGALFDSLTVAENVLFSLELREDYDEQNKEDVVNGLLKMVDIYEARDAYPADLSPVTSAPSPSRGRWRRSRSAFSMTSPPPWSIPSCRIIWPS